MKKLSISNKLPDSNSKYFSPLPDSDHPYGRASAMSAPSLPLHDFSGQRFEVDAHRESVESAERAVASERGDLDGDENRHE